MKSKVVFEQIDLPVTKKTEYKVIHLTNRTRPLIGTRMTEEEIHALRQGVGDDLTTEIKPAKTRK